MKNQLLLLFIFGLITFQANAQSVYNNGFEQLNSDGTLSNWGNVYLLTASIDSTGNPQIDSIVYDGSYYAPSSDANSGSTALELRNSWNYTTNKGISGAAAVDDDSVFSAYGLFNLVPTYATPFNPFQPFNFGFDFKYNPVNGDTAYAEITLWDSSGNQLGGGLILITDSATSYKHIDAPLTYINSNTVDFYTFSIGTFYSTVPGSHEPSFGTRLLVDDIGFNFVTGINDAEQASGLSVYPNPASEFLTLIYKDVKANEQYIITDISGRKISHGLITGEKTQISTEALVNGIYILRANTTEIKIVVTKTTN